MSYNLRLKNESNVYIECNNDKFKIVNLIVSVFIKKVQKSEKIILVQINMMNTFSKRMIHILYLSLQMRTYIRLV